MLTRETMRGLYVLTITPFDSQNRLDEDAYRENVRFLVGLGVDGIITTGTNGEFHTTTDDERARIARLVAEETKGRAVSVVGASGVNTAEAIARTRSARDAGADAVMNVIPYYHILSKAEAYQYFEDLHAACPDIGIIVYNNPMTTQVLLNDNDFLRIEQVPTVCGTKMTGADLWMYLNCLRRTHIRHFPLEQLWGISQTVGGNGVMASFIYAFPHYMMRWWKAISCGQGANALAMQHEVNAILQDLVLPLIIAEGYNEIAATKAVVDAAGFLKAGAPRKPFRPVPAERIEQLRSDLGEHYPQFLQ
jgi:4-hydroxy-tetrahydrodipicolinate synthase